MNEINEAARMLGRLGGLSRSEAKIKAARENGKKRKKLVDKNEHDNRIPNSPI